MAATAVNCHLLIRKNEFLVAASLKCVSTTTVLSPHASIMYNTMAVYTNIPIGVILTVNKAQYADVRVTLWLSINFTHEVIKYLGKIRS